MIDKWKKRLSQYEVNWILKMLVLFLASLGGYYLFIAIAERTGSVYGTYPCIGAFVILAILWVSGQGKTVYSEARGIFLIFASSLALKLDYIYYTSCYMRQQDTLIFDVPMGHLGYIGYLYYNRHLPDFDTRTAWSFSHPPLHHIISAIWVRIGTKLGMDIALAIEGIQILTVVYSCGILLFLYLILKEFNIKGRILYAIMLIFAFHPIFIIMSGSVNNDVLSVMFMTGAILYTIRWYRDSSMKNILILAVMIGCAMMSKVSAGIVAVGVAAVFLIKLIRDRHLWKQYFVRFAAFGVVVFPLGLWYPIRNNILFGVPLTYAEKLKMDSDQFIGDVDLWKRFTDFSSYQFDHLNVQFEAAGTYREFNVWISLLKTTIFSYFDFYLDSSILTMTGTALFWINVGLIVLCTIAGAAVLLRARKNMPVEKLFFLIVLVVFMASYLKFCVEYPHISTMNIRYIIPVLQIGLFYLAIAISEGKEGSGARRDLARRAEGLVVWVAAAWTALSCVMFVALGLV